VEDASSPFAATTSDGTAAFEDEWPVAIAPFATPPVAVDPPPVALDPRPVVLDPPPVALDRRPVALDPLPVALDSPTSEAPVAATRAPTPPPRPAEPIAEAIAEALAPPPPAPTSRANAPYPATLPDSAPPSRQLFEADEATNAREQRAVKTDTFAVARPRSKKPVLLAFAAIVVGLAVIFGVTRKKTPGTPAAKPDEVAVADPPSEPTPAPAAVTDDAAPADPSAPPPGPADPAPLDSPVATPPITATPPTGTATAGPRTTRGKGRGKNPKAVAVIEAPEVPTGDGLVDAKAAYNAGNKALYAADAAGAISQFQAAIRSAPGFAAAHRGLGLAYSLSGDRVRAVSEFKAYLAASPGARDTQKIQERITALQAAAK